jgi:hypothetical protein
MPQSVTEPNFGFVFWHLWYSDFSPVTIFDPPSFSAIHAIIGFATQAVRWWVLFPSRFTHSCVARRMGSRARVHSFSSQNWESFDRREYTLDPKWSVRLTSRKEWPFIRLQINMFSHEKFWFGDILLFGSNRSGMIDQREKSNLCVIFHFTYRTLPDPSKFGRIACDSAEHCTRLSISFAGSDELSAFEFCRVMEWVSAKVINSD